ncbi:lytic transglycosylase domain-containing protein [Sulfitobacter sp. F26204]|uniref:lytic transglycosylase domain-containing protein n=1 Tax=Sulfitobacter sp. F26204 TaxID=2996014 RepID=UPI002B1F34CC|nr:lytic transglycosylase domain-containing protein [Sulfitobacter sp. F26204]
MVRRVAAQYLDHPGIAVVDMSGLQWLALFRANIGIESNFRQSAVSPAGAIGLGQLMPGTARVLRVDPHDAEENLHGSARYLLAQMLKFRSAQLALAAYNAGPEAVTRYGGIPPYRETQEHVVKVFALYRATIPQENL